MRKPLAFYWRSDVPNIGDVMSSPFHYFDFPGFEKVVVPHGTPHHPSNWHATIIGGGVYRAVLSKYPRINEGPIIGWGVGSSLHGSTKTRFSYGGDLVGTRDYPHADTYLHVPCASCMHPAFGPDAIEIPTSQFEAGFFYNADLGSLRHLPNEKVIKGLPRLGNHAPMDEVLDFIRSVEVLVTNSYHGAYWGQLLGRRVIVVNGYSSKFHGFRFPITHARPDEPWQSAYLRSLKDARMTLHDPADPVRYARQQNEEMYRRVLTLINE